MSSEINATLSAVNFECTEISDEKRENSNSLAQTLADLGVEVTATTKQGSDSSESISESSDSTTSISTGDDGCSLSISGASSQPDPIETTSPTAEFSEDGANTQQTESEDNTSGGALPFDLRKMLIQFGKELLCLFAIALTTYATLQNGPPKISRAPPPVPLFSKNSMVQEWPSGHLNVIQSKVSTSELSFVLFYAPWCAESQFAKEAYEEVSYKYHKEVYFSAVNCWQPGGECRLHYAKVQTWPVLMAYFPQGVAVQYNGPWLVQPLSRFIENLMKPYKRISNKNELDVLRIDSNSVVVGFFNSEQLKQSDFFIFVQSAIKWLEKDPYQDVQFAIVTGESYRNFNVEQTPAVRLYNWNETLDLQLSKFTVDNITRWLKNHLNFITTWLHPPGKKSTTLAPYLKSGPTVLFFTPKDYYSFNKDAYHLLKHVALDYHQLKNSTKEAQVSGASIYSLREKNLKTYLNLKSKCANMSQSRNEENDSEMFKACTPDEPNITFANILNSSKYDKLIEDSEHYCYIGPKDKDSAAGASCQSIYNREWRQSFKMKAEHFKSTAKSGLSMLNPETDNRSSLKLLEKSQMKECDALRLSVNSHGKDFFEIDRISDKATFVSNAREFNQTFSFLLLDSIMYKPFAIRLGIDIDTSPKKSSVIIIDNDNDSTYHMKGEISTNSIKSFIKHFISGTVKRKLRSTKRTTASISNKQISIREVDSVEFRDYLNHSRRTFVVLFYSVQCALCSLFSQTLLMVAKILEAMDIDFLRIDSDINDLQWHYTMDTYPTLIIFPGNRSIDSRVFPHSMEVNVPNILGFIIANMSPEERLQAIYASCQYRRASSSIQNCLFTMRVEISNNISISLRRWRHYPKRRNGVLRKLQLLQRIYLKSFQIDTLNDFDTIRKDVIQFKQLREK